MAGGAPLGNKNGSKSQRLWTDMLKRKLVQDPNQLERIALTLLAAAEAGEAWAITEMANRLDGKAVQPVDMSGDLSLTRTMRDMTDDALLAIAQGGVAKTENDGDATQH